MLVDVGDTRLNVEERGTGDIALIALHGGPGLDHTMFGTWLDPDGDEYRLLLVDERAQGRSDPAPPETWTLEHHARDVDALATALGLERYVVLGHSFGAFIALQHAVDFPGRPVLMTAMGANAADTPFRRVEQELAASGLAYNIIRPNWFMQNFQTFWLHGINASNTIALPAGTAKTSFIDARDIAAVAARLLTTHDQDGREFDLTGPEALTHDDVARILSKEAGRDIRYQDIDPGVLRKGLLAGGVPADYTEFLLVILGFLKQGYSERTTDDVEKLLGRKPIAFTRYARDARAAWNPAKAA